MSSNRTGPCLESMYQWQPKFHSPAVALSVMEHEMVMVNDRDESLPASFEEVSAQLKPLLEELQSGPAYHAGTLERAALEGSVRLL